MTQEEKAKRYDEAIERARSLTEFCSDNELKTLEYVFHELKESEDDKIRKEIISAVNIYCSEYCRGAKVREDMLSWLEKQGEQKPTWSEEDETRLTNTIIMLKEGASLHFNKKDITKTIDWLKSLKDIYSWKPSDEHYELEEFAKIVRSNLTGISKVVQELFEAKYLQLTGNKMYKGFKD